MIDPSRAIAPAVPPRLERVGQERATKPRQGRGEGDRAIRRRRLVLLLVRGTTTSLASMLSDNSEQADRGAEGSGAALVCILTPKLTKRSTHLRRRSAQAACGRERSRCGWQSPA
eukprot:14045607-Alexandrium_andersonii.AAC.1